MELNREQIIKALKCISSTEDVLCAGCDYRKYDGLACHRIGANNALALIKELTEENERLRGERAKFFEYKHGTLVRNALVLTKNKKEFDDFCKAIKADTVRKMQERLMYEFGFLCSWELQEIKDTVDQITKEMLEGL